MCVRGDGIILTLHLPGLAKVAKFGEGLAVPLVFRLRDVSDDDVTVSRNILYLSRRHFCKVVVFDYKKNRRAIFQARISGRGEMVSWASIDIVSLDKILHIPECEIFEFRL